MYATVHRLLYLCDCLEQTGKASKEGRRDGFPRARTDDSKSSFSKSHSVLTLNKWKVFCHPIPRSATSIPGFEKVYEGIRSNTINIGSLIHFNWLNNNHHLGGRGSRKRCATK